jgi:hypothetical protein
MKAHRINNLVWTAALLLMVFFGDHRWWLTCVLLALVLAYNVWWYRPGWAGFSAFGNALRGSPAFAAKYQLEPGAGQSPDPAMSGLSAPPAPAGEGADPQMNLRTAVAHIIQLIEGGDFPAAIRKYLNPHAWDRVRPGVRDGNLEGLAKPPPAWMRRLHEMRLQYRPMLAALHSVERACPACDPPVDTATFVPDPEEAAQSKRRLKNLTFTKVDGRWFLWK